MNALPSIAWGSASCVLALVLAACSGGVASAPGSGGGDGGAAQGGGGQGGVSDGGGGQGGAAPPGSLVVGLNVSPLESSVSAASLRVEMRVDHAVIRDETFGTGEPAPIDLPKEFAFEDLPDGTEVEILFETDPGYDLPLQQRVARSHIAAGRTSLLRVTMSGYVGCPPCDANLTCNWGRCLDPYLAPELLEEYTPDWTSYSWCKPKVHGEPSALLGTGFVTFTPLNDLDVVDVHPGPQGGHHVFVALRMRNLRQMSTVELRAFLPELNAEIGPLTFNNVFPDDPAAGYCESLGTIFQLDQLLDINDLLGKTIELTARIDDADGDTVEETRTAVLPAQIQ